MGKDWSLLNIDWRKTLTLLACFIAMLGLSIYIMRPSDAELEARGGQSPAPVLNIPDERIAITFDERVWVLAKELRQEGKYTAEYTPQGDSYPGWKERLTIQAFGGIQDKGTVEDFAAAVQQHITEWAKDKVLWKVVAVSDNELLYEWQVVGKENFADQYEICRIMKGAQGIHLVHYTTRQLPIDAAIRDIWLKKLLSARLQMP